MDSLQVSATQRCRYCQVEKPKDRAHFTHGDRKTRPVTTICLDCAAFKKSVPEGHKFCGKCATVKPLDGFRRVGENKPQKQSYCSLCMNTYSNEYQRKNREELRVKTRAREAAQGESFKVRRKAHNLKWRAKDEAKELAKASSRRYREKYPEKARADASRRRAERAAIPGNYTGHDVRDKFRIQRGLCFYCEVRVGAGGVRWEVDHFIPVSRGGTNHPENIVVACQDCNRRKHARLPHEFMPDRFPPPAAT